jgi:ATP-binding cassette subfamily B protein
MQQPENVRENLSQTLQLNRTLAFVWRAAPGAALLSGTLVLIQGLFPLAVLYMIKLIVDAADQAIASPGTHHLPWILVLVAVAGAISLIRSVCQQAAELANETLSMKVADHVYDRLHRKSLSMDLEFYENPAYFDTLHRAQMEGPQRPARIVNSLVGIGREGISLAAVTGLLLYFHWAVPLILFAAVIPGVLVRIRFSREMFAWQNARTETQREAGYLNWLITGYVHAKEVRLFGLGGFFAERFSALRTLLRTEKLKISRRRCIASILAQAASVAAMFGVLGFIVFRAVLGLISIGDLVMYYQAIQRGLGFFQGLLSGLAGLYEDNLFISYFYELMDVEEKITDPQKPRKIPERFQRGITLENVGFTYPGSGQPALQGVNFSILPGEVVALVGGNGAGKSTLAKLLCRLYDTRSGRITIDGADIREFRLSELRRKTAVMLQDFATYHFTARKNIRLGNLEVPAESPEIENAAKKAAAHDFIRGLPKGYDTILGKMFANGEDLSEGEWQKIALARVFLRDAELVILDEPASSLDADSEYEIFKNLRNLLCGKSAVLISHRFSTVKMADRIIVLQNGRLIEQGGHQELLQNDGAYARWYEKQALVAGRAAGSGASGKT